MKVFPRKFLKSSLISYGLISCLSGCIGNISIEDDARTKIGAITRGEIAHIYELNRFTSNFDELGININPETKYYSYKFIQMDDQKIVQFAAVAKTRFLRSYTGVVYVGTTRNEYTVKYIICESDNPTIKSPEKVELINHKVNCPQGYSLIQ